MKRSLFLATLFLAPAIASATEATFVVDDTTITNCADLQKLVTDEGLLEVRKGNCEKITVVASRLIGVHGPGTTCPRATRVPVGYRLRPKYVPYSAQTRDQLKCDVGYRCDYDHVQERGGNF